MDALLPAPASGGAADKRLGAASGAARHGLPQIPGAFRRVFDGGAGDALDASASPTGRHPPAERGVRAPGLVAGFDGDTEVPASDTPPEDAPASPDTAGVPAADAPRIPPEPEAPPLPRTASEAGTSVDPRGPETRLRPGFGQPAGPDAATMSEGAGSPGGTAGTDDGEDSPRTTGSPANGQRPPAPESAPVLLLGGQRATPRASFAEPEAVPQPAAQRDRTGIVPVSSSGPRTEPGHTGEGPKGHNRVRGAGADATGSVPAVARGTGGNGPPAGGHSAPPQETVGASDPQHGGSGRAERLAPGSDSTAKGQVTDIPTVGARIMAATTAPDRRLATDDPRPDVSSGRGISTAGPGQGGVSADPGAATRPPELPRIASNPAASPLPDDAPASRPQASVPPSAGADDASRPVEPGRAGVSPPAGTVSADPARFAIAAGAARTGPPEARAKAPGIEMPATRANPVQAAHPETGATLTRQRTVAQPGDHAASAAMEAKPEMRHATLVPEPAAPLQAAAQGTAPATAPPAATASPSGLAQATAQQIVASLPAPLRELGSAPLEIALDPPELGRVRLSLVEAGGGMTLSIVAERPETAELMRRHVDLLAQEFSRSGLDAPNVRVGTGSAGGGEMGGHGQHGPPVPEEPGRDGPEPGADAPGIPADGTGPGDPARALDLRL
jgi:hypothetical protein